MRGEDRTLEVRAVLLVLGASLGIAGMATERRWLIYAGMGVIALGGALAIIRRINQKNSRD